MTGEQDLPAGAFSSWLRHIRIAQINDHGVDVPCGACLACCKSSYFIHIRPEETQTLACIPRKILFPAPGLPKGNMLLGYDERGCCPMPVNDRCSIYEHRPLTCRGYDCRVFVAAGIEADDDNKALITRHVRRWKFSYPTRLDRDQHAAVQAAALFLRECEKRLPAGFVPSNTTQLAVLAIKVYDVFLDYTGEFHETGRIAQDLEIAGAVVKAHHMFEARRKAQKARPL